MITRTAALLCGLLAAASWAQTDLVNVRDCGALGDGTADDTNAFVDAVAQGKASGQQVYVPRGRYRISGTVELDNIGLTGPPVGAWPADVDALPSILPVHGDGPAFHLGAGGALQGIDITCASRDDWETGPAAVLISGIGAYVRNCRIRYPWDGIITDGKSNVGRLSIENVFVVSPKNVGVRVTGTWDVPALRNIEVWNAGPVKRGLEKGIGFHLGKNDLIRVTDCFAFAMQTGFLLEDEIEGCAIKGGTWGCLTGCSTDFCSRGIVVRGEHTVSITGGTYWDHHEGLLVEGDARVRITGAEVKSNGAPAVVVRQADQVVVNGCSLLRTMEGHSPPAVVFESGRLVLSGNHIEARGDGVSVGAGIVAGTIQGNLIDAHGNAAVECDPAAMGRIMVEGNLEQKSEE